MHPAELHPEGTSPPEETALPKNPEIPVTEWGPVVLASHPFSTPWTNGMILDMLPAGDREAAAELIANTGIRTRYFRDLSLEPDIATVVAESARKSAVLVRRVMDRKGWTTIDGIIDTSAILPDSFSRTLTDTLGFEPDSLYRRSVRAACAGVATAFTDALSDANLRGKRIVIIAAEPLSAIVHPDIFTADRIGIPAIFGDDFAAIAFNPSDFELVAARTVVIPDHGVIRVRPFYRPPPHQPDSLPGHYELSEGAGEIFSSTPEGIFLRYLLPEEGHDADMNGSATAKFFIRHTPPVIAWVLNEALRQGISPENVIAHQPSLPVVEGTNRALARSGFPQQIRFLLTEMDRSNSSSATTAVSWQYQAEHGLIDPAKPTLITAPGIGSIITASVFVPSTMGWI